MEMVEMKLKPLRREATSHPFVEWGESTAIFNIFVSEIVILSIFPFVFSFF